MADMEKHQEDSTSPSPSQYTSDNLTDVASIISGSDTISTITSSPSAKAALPEDSTSDDEDEEIAEQLDLTQTEVTEPTSVENVIDWDELIAVEKRMVCEDQDTALFLERLNHLKDDDWEECNLPVQSIADLKQVISGAHELPFNDIPNIPSINYNDSELSLWSALIAEYRQAAVKVPKYASIMIRSGIPPALRGLAWMSLSESSTPTLRSLYDSLAAEWTPFVKIIGRDLNRTFPEIKMFREKGGEGQLKLGRVLRAYSAYDMQVGYCQGLTFLTGPLLLHMSDRDAFCVLAKLMEDYELRSMFTADMSGLQLRIYQFESLFADQFPDLYRHFIKLGVNSIYASQWFLSFFAVTCPLGMLVRIFDLTFAEGAVPTLMRVALAVLKRNEQLLKSFDDDEQVLQHMLGRCLWELYGLDADLLITDVCSIDACTNERLRALETEFKEGGKPIRPRNNKPAVQPLPVVALFSSLPFGFKWPVAVQPPSTPLPAEVPTHKSRSSDLETLRHSKSGMSIASFDSESNANPERFKSYQSSASSFSSTDNTKTPKSLAYAAAESHALKDQIASLTAEVEKLKFELLNRDRIEQEQEASEDTTTTGSTSKKVDACCEGLRMELALAKTNEVLARQEIEQLKHSLHKKTAAVVHTTPVVHTTTAHVAAESIAAADLSTGDAEVQPPVQKGWSIW